MSGKIVNLRQAKKRRTHEDKAREADANAVQYGQKKAATDLAKARAEKSARDLDGHKRD